MARVVFELDFTNVAGSVVSTICRGDVNVIKQTDLQPQKISCHLLAALYATAVGQPLRSHSYAKHVFNSPNVLERLLSQLNTKCKCERNKAWYEMGIKLKANVNHP